MDKLVTADRPCHWYLPDGTPFYSVPYADKKRAGEMRPATITDARKAGAVPSVTTILRILAKPGLESWKIEQAILAALTLPKQDGERLEDFAKRVVEDAQEEGGAAAAAGSAIHDAVMAHIEGREYPPEMQPYIGAYTEWENATGLHGPKCETSFACTDCGGRIDLLYDNAVVDIKTVTSKPGKPMPRYDEWPLQLVAYDEGTPLPKRRLINLIFSRNEPGRWEVAEYTENYIRHLSAWWHILATWKYLNNW